MGPPTDPDAVVNPRLQVYGIKGNELIFVRQKLLYDDSVFLITFYIPKKDYALWIHQSCQKLLLVIQMPLHT